MSGRKVKLGVAGACVIAVAVAAILISSDSRDSGSASPPQAGIEEAALRVDNPSSAEGEPQTTSENLPANTDTQAGGNQPPTVDWTPYGERVADHEALPCTDADEPVNFEIFSAGPSVAGVPLNAVTRRCGATTPPDEPPANLISYIYGSCQPSGTEGSCEPPLQIQTFPACQRSLADYSYEGKPMPYRRLPDIGGAEVVEIEFEFGPRIEVYTKSSTIVIFAADPELAEQALKQLRSQVDELPATKAGELTGPPDEHLAPPTDGATEGELSC